MFYKLKKRKNLFNKNKFILIVISLLISSIGVGYAYMKSNLSMSADISLAELPGTLKVITDNYTGEFWAYKSGFSK